jgi:hypothetical protein
MMTNRTRSPGPALMRVSARLAALALIALTAGVMLAPETALANGIGSTTILRDDATGLCLDSNYNYDAYTGGCNGGNYQNWNIVAVPGGLARQVQLYDAQTGLCLYIPVDGGVGTLIHSECDNNQDPNYPSSLWIWVGGTHGGQYYNPQVNRCLDSNQAGALYTQPCNGGNYQNWTQATGSIYSGIAGKCVDDYGGNGNNGDIVDLYTCNNSSAQNWTPMTDGTIRLDVGGRCMDIYGGGTGNGTPVDLWNCNGGANQQWRQQGNELVNPVSGRCLDDPHGSTANGTQLEIWDCNGGVNQQWILP